MSTVIHKSSDQQRAEALTRSIRAEVRRLNKEGTKEEAMTILKGAGIIDSKGNLTKHYRSA